MEFIQSLFGQLLAFLYQLTDSYGIALILFAIVVKVVLLYPTAKGKRSTMKMSRLAPRVQAIQQKYANDPQKQNEAVRALYQEEGVSMGGGCLWSLLPLLLMFPLYAIIREPIKYMLGEGENLAVIMNTLKGLNPDLGAVGSVSNVYEQVIAAPMLPQFAEQLKAAIPAISEATLQGIDTTFLGINLGLEPTFSVWNSSYTWVWSNIGATLIPLLSAGTQVLSMFISQKLNNSLVTDEKGLQDKETAKNSQQGKQGKMMLWMMPLMSLWIGYSIPCALSLYWLIQGLVNTVFDVILTKRYRKIYDEEDAERLRRALAAEAEEAEKERLRAERRAANPDGITQNTSKKKLQQQQKAEQEAARAAAKKEYEARKGAAEEHAEEETPATSGDARRPFSRGRAYDPNRYKGDNTEE